MVYLLLLVGLSMLLLGANYLVDSSVVIARRAHISDFIIGLTIVGIGTSAPEMIVSFTSSFRGLGDMALGNIVGSNICNIMLILGVTAMIAPVAITRLNLRRDISFGILVSAFLAALCYSPEILGIGAPGLSRLAGILMLACFAAFMWYMITDEKKHPEPADEPAEGSKLQRMPLLGILIVAIASLGLLLWGGNIFLDSAEKIARLLGLSDAVISITVLAVGTSLPELITSIVAATKNNAQLALGNVFGSNIFNILLILGGSAIISPISLQGIGLVDFGVLLGASILVGIFAFTLRRRVIDRAEGALLVLLYIAYIVWLLH